MELDAHGPPGVGVRTCEALLRGTAAASPPSAPVCNRTVCDWKLRSVKIAARLEGFGERKVGYTERTRYTGGGSSIS